MSRFYSVFGFVLAVGLIGLLVWAVVRGVIEEPGVVGSFATAAAAIAALVYGRAREQKLALQASHRERMAPIYRELIEQFVRADESDDLSPVFQSFMFDLTLFGPTPIVEAWVRWIRFVSDIDPADPQAMFEWEAVLAAIRKDLGHDAGELRQGDLLRIFVNDIDQYLTAERPKLG